MPGGILDKYCRVTPSVRPLISGWRSEQLLRGGDTGATLTVGLHLNGMPDTNLCEGHGAVPSWPTFSGDGTGRLVMEKVREEIVYSLQEVREFMLNRNLVDC